MQIFIEKADNVKYIAPNLMLGGDWRLMLNTTTTSIHMAHRTTTLLISTVTESVVKQLSKSFL